MLKTATAQRERAELENKGISLAIIYELSKVLDLQKIAKELSVRTDPWSNVSQGWLGQNGYTNGKSQNVNKDSNHVNNDLSGVNNSETINNGHLVDM